MLDLCSKIENARVVYRTDRQDINICKPYYCYLFVYSHVFLYLDIEHFVQKKLMAFIYFCTLTIASTLEIILKGNIHLHLVVQYSRGRLSVSLFIYFLICWNSRMTALLLCYSMTPCVSKCGISAGTSCHLWGSFQYIALYVGLNKLPLATVEACPVALHSVLQHRRYKQRIGGS